MYMYIWVYISIYISYILGSARVGSVSRALPAALGDASAWAAGVGSACAGVLGCAALASGRARCACAGKASSSESVSTLAPGVGGAGVAGCAALASGSVSTSAPGVGGAGVAGCAALASGSVGTLAPGRRPALGGSGGCDGTSLLFQRALPGGSGGVCTARAGGCLRAPRGSAMEVATMVFACFEAKPAILIMYSTIKRGGTCLFCCGLNGLS